MSFVLGYMVEEMLQYIIVSCFTIYEFFSCIIRCRGTPGCRGQWQCPFISCRREAIFVEDRVAIYRRREAAEQQSWKPLLVNN